MINLTSNSLIIWCRSVEIEAGTLFSRSVASRKATFGFGLDGIGSCFRARKRCGGQERAKLEVLQTRERDTKLEQFVSSETCPLSPTDSLHYRQKTRRVERTFKVMHRRSESAEDARSRFSRNSDPIFACTSACGPEWAPRAFVSV